MDHISANLEFGLRKKNYWGTKSSRGQKAYKKNREKSGDLFFVCFLFFGDIKNFVGAAKKSAGGTKW